MTVAGVLVIPAVAATAVPAHPRIGAVSPTAGPVKGGNRLTIRGRHLGKVTAVTIGGERATKLKHVSPQRIEVVVPKHAKGRTRGHVISSFGRSGSSVRYTYTAPPKITNSTSKTIDPAQGQLEDLSCPTADFCAAIDAGDDSTHRLVIIRTGQPASTTRVSSVFLTVSCGSPTYCIALTEDRASVWNGTSWGAFHAVGTHTPSFEWISCVVGTQVCLATGEYVDAIVFHGADWQAVARPTDAELGDVSCASATFCVSVGYESSYVYRGTKWVDGPTPTGLEGPFGASVSCVTSTFCLAMDGVGDVARFDGTAWHKTAALGHNRFYGNISCASTTECLTIGGANYAVEYKNGSFGSEQPVAGVRDVSWVSCIPDGACVAVTFQGQLLQHSTAGWTAPTMVTPSTGDLADVSCVSATWCMAVDAKGNALHGAGTSWTKPQQIDGFRGLLAISCASTAVCVAVDGDGYAVLYQHGTWSAPQRIDSASAPTDVDCPSATKCFVVDDDGQVLTWSGAHWSAPKKVSIELDGISCATTTMCVAVGRHSKLLTHGTWTAIAAPVNAYALNAVTCLRTTYCVAAGSGGFFVWHHRTWSRAIGHVPNGFGVTIGCSSDLVCRGFVDDSESLYTVDFAGGATSVYGADDTPAISCVPNSVCVTVSDDRVVTSR